MPTSDAGAVRVVAVWQAPPGGAEKIRDILGQLAAETRHEPGCLGFQVLRADADPGRFVLLESYADPAARAAHLRSAHFRRLVLDTAVPLLAHRHVDAYHTIHAGRPGGAGQPDHDQPTGKDTT